MGVRRHERERCVDAFPAAAHLATVIAGLASLAAVKPRREQSARHDQQDDSAGSDALEYREKFDVGEINGASRKHITPVQRDRERWEAGATPKSIMVGD